MVISMEKKFYYCVVYFGNDSTKVAMTLDNIDSLLERGYVVQVIQRVKVLKDLEEFL